jgi:ribosomal protein S18 acetylase RimI-like enzyme
MSCHFPSVLEYGLEPTAAVLTAAFADYFAPAPMTAADLVQMARTDSVDLTASRVVVRDGNAVGAALVARRGWTSRLAAMGIVPAARRTGAGRAVLENLLAAARARGERTMVLEVIEQNDPAVRLYESAGFTRVRRLMGFAGPGTNPPAAAPTTDPIEVDPRELAAVVIREGLPDLPWQLSGETLAHLSPPATAFRLEGAWLALAATSGPIVTIRGVVTERKERGRGRAQALLRAVMARHSGKQWRVPAIWPAELAGVFARAGLVPQPLSQWQMTCPL